MSAIRVGRSAHWLGALTASLAISHIAAAQAPPASPNPNAATVGRPARASFRGELASDPVREVADWVVRTADNSGRPFIIVDKVDAEVFVFDPHGQLDGAAPALLGLAKGDDTFVGVGDRPLSAVRPEQRTTPAGRFVANLGRDYDEKSVLWIDYAAGIAMHRVVTSNPKEHRLERLATPTPLDNRISFGCVNLPAKFYDSVVSPAFAGTDGVVYILPEVKSLEQVFFAHQDPSPAGGGRAAQAGGQ